MIDHLGADRKAFLFFAKDVVVFDQLLLSCLNGKIGLADGNHLFARVAVLNDEIAGIAGQHEIVNLSLCAAADCNHFADIGKMVFDGISAVLARFFCTFYHFRKTPPLGIFQYRLQLTGQPIFLTVCIGVLDGFKSGVGVFFNIRHCLILSLLPRRAVIPVSPCTAPRPGPRCTRRSFPLCGG